MIIIRVSPKTLLLLLLLLIIIIMHLSIFSPRGGRAAVMPWRLDSQKSQPMGIR